MKGQAHRLDSIKRVPSWTEVAIPDDERGFSFETLIIWYYFCCKKFSQRGVAW
jgi:hypothetical protein